MSQSDWGFFPDNASNTTVLFGVTAGETPPPGGGSFTFGFNSVVDTTGCVALYAAQTGFAPMAKGCSITAAIKRGVSGSPLNFSPFLFACCGANSVAGNAYILGLNDEDPHNIALVKGPLNGGVPGVNPPTSGVLAVGNESFANNTWLQIRMDVIINTNGDVVLNLFRNDLTAVGASVAAPIWIPLPGANTFIDDALGINSGSLPYAGGGYAGFGYFTKDITRRAFFDEFTLAKQI